MDEMRNLMILRFSNCVKGVGCPAMMVACPGISAVAESNSIEGPAPLSTPAKDTLKEPPAAVVATMALMDVGNCDCVLMASLPVMLPVPVSN